MRALAIEARRASQNLDLLNGTRNHQVRISTFSRFGSYWIQTGKRSHLDKQKTKQATMSGVETAFALLESTIGQ